MAENGRIDALLQQVRLRQSLPPCAERHRIRIEAGVSLREMAEALGVSHTAVKNWERASNPRTTTMNDDYGLLLRELKKITAARRRP